MRPRALPLLALATLAAASLPGGAVHDLAAVQRLAAPEARRPPLPAEAAQGLLAPPPGLPAPPPLPGPPGLAPVAPAWAGPGGALPGPAAPWDAAPWDAAPRSAAPWAAAPWAPGAGLPLLEAFADLRREERLDARLDRDVALDPAAALHALALGAWGPAAFAELATVDHDERTRASRHQEVDYDDHAAAAALALGGLAARGVAIPPWLVADVTQELTVKATCTSKPRLDEDTVVAGLALRGPGLATLQDLVSVDRRCKVERSFAQDVDVDPAVVLRAIAVAGGG